MDSSCVTLDFCISGRPSTGFLGVGWRLNNWPGLQYMFDKGECCFLSKGIILVNFICDYKTVKRELGP